MGFLKRFKFSKRARNRNTGVIRGILKCLLPCVRRTSRSASPGRSRSPSPEGIINENKTKENCEKTTHGQTGPQYEVLEHTQTQQEVLHIQQKTHEEETSLTRMWTAEGPRSSQFDALSPEKTEQDHPREAVLDFEIIRSLGEGAFGHVLMVKKTWTDGQRSREDLFAIKTVPHKFVSEVEREVFVRAVGHPFLVQLLIDFKTEDSHWYVMEYLEGGTLDSLLLRLERLPEDLSRFYAAEIILAVKFLHACGILHRDIKPQNLLLDKDGHCKLADFGVAKVGMCTWDKTGGIFGTLEYMAPEILQGHLYGPEVDWWSVGCVMDDMLLGRGHDLDVLLYPEQYQMCVSQDAVSIIKMVVLEERSSFVKKWL